MSELLSKRELLKAGVTVGAVAAMDTAAAFLSPYLPDKANPPVPIEYESFPLRNSQLRVVMTEHDERDWRRNGPAIATAIANAGIVIPEYLPTEYRSLTDTVNPYNRPVAWFNKPNGLFNHIASYAAGKPRWVVDPEHNEQGVDLRYELDSPALLAEIGIALGLSHRRKTNRMILDRRKFIKVASGAAATVGMMTNLLGELNVEDDFRQAVSADLLTKLDDEGKFATDTPKPVTLFIPKAHWAGIKSYLLQPQARKARVELYKRYFSPQFPSLFEARYYAPGNTSDKATEKVSLLK